MKEFFKGGWGKSILVGVVVFLLLDFISTNTNDDFKKSLFKEGYLSGVADAQWVVNHKDTIFIKKDGTYNGRNDSIITQRINERIDLHWERVLDLIKNGDE